MIDLKNILKGKAVVVCLGNIDRGDDGIGPHIAAAIKGRAGCVVIDAGTVPENYTGVIKKLAPDVIIIVDAVCFEGRPGEIRLFSVDQIRSGKISTHDVSPMILVEYLKSSVKAEFYMLGIMPKSNKFGDGLSEEAARAVREVKRLFLD